VVEFQVLNNVLSEETFCAMKIFNTDFKISDILALAPRSAGAVLSPARMANMMAVFSSERRCADRVDGLPFAVMIEPAAVCDMKCPICAIAVSPPRETAFMELDVYKNIVDELSGAAMFLSLWNWGEPLLNPRIEEMAGHATRRNMLSAIHTNGRTLKGRKAEGMIEGGLCYLVVSFDGAARESYGVIRGEENFGLVRGNVEAFTALKKKTRSRLPIVEIKMIVTRDNENEMSEFIKLGRSMGADRVTFRRLVWSHNEKVMDMAPIHEEYRQKYTMGSSVRKGKVPCNRLWRSSVILANGDVTPCCSDTRFEYIMGNVNDPGGFRKIWNNEKYRAFRRGIMENPHSIPICRTCPADSFRGDTFIKPSQRGLKF
jgi:radical SAM protein with 4Fe4S-binding SPASM domain